MSLALLVSLLPLNVAAVEPDGDAIRSKVTQLVKQQAAAVYRPDADDDAFSAFFKYGFFGNGGTYTFDDNHAFVSALWNACLTQELLIESLFEGISYLQKYEEDTVYLKGLVSWHNFYYNYHMRGFMGTKEDYTQLLPQLVSASNKYESGTYEGPRNENDSLMELIAGGIRPEITVRCTEKKANSAVYSIDLKFTDTFEFEGKYEDVQDKGYDTGKDDSLNNLGFLLTYVGLKEFDWSYEKSFRLELPYHCDHGAKNYHFTYHGDTITVSSEAGSGYTKNDTTKHIYEYVDAETGEASTRYYHETDDTIVLRHDQPWVVEYDQKMIRTHQFTPLDSHISSMPAIYSSGLTGIWVFFMEWKQYDDPKAPNNTILSATRYYVGVELLGRVKYNKNHLNMIRLENVVNDDGSNMIYVSLYDKDTGETLLPPEPMNHLWVKKDSDTDRVFVGSASNRVSGMDIKINYLGNTNTGLDASDTVLDLRIWEGGKAPSEGSYKAPTCTDQGGTEKLCLHCGEAYLTQAEPALGHTYGEYVFDNNMTCTTDGTQTRKCSRCGEKDTVTAPDTATGHDYKAVVTEPTYTEQGYTTYTCHCGDSYKADYTDVKVHQYEAVVTEPTCTEQGYTTYTCTECGDTFVDDFTELAEHTPVIDPAVAPTCVEKGKTEGSHCDVCGLVLKKQALISTVDTHRMEESIVKMPTYEEAGTVAYTCADCGKTDYMEIPPLTKPAPVNPFTDVTESDWFYNPVLWAVENKVTGGKTTTIFAPNEGCTRAQVVTFLWAANGKPEPENMENRFTDVANDAWYLKPVLWAVEQGITSGISATEFGPEQTCTRAQIVTFLWAAQGKHAVSGDSVFADVDDTAWYTAPIIWAAENEVTGGIGNGMFGPENTCTRAQVVTFLKKIYG